MCWWIAALNFVGLSPGPLMVPGCVVPVWRMVRLALYLVPTGVVANRQFVFVLVEIPPD